MEQPPGRLDDLQPQVLSTSGITTVIDLTRNNEECVVNATSLDALTKVKSPGWYPNSGTSNPGLPFSETDSSDITLQSGDQVQPDNAFSHTTVTLSYVSRSHIFSTQDSLSRHSPLCGVPSVNKLSLHPPCDSDEVLGEAGYALNQHYLEQVDGPVDLATQTQLFQSQAQVGPEKNGGVCQTQMPQEFSSGVVSGSGDVDNHEQGPVEHSLSGENGVVLENGQGDGWSAPGASAESSPETLAAGGERGGPEVLFLMSKKPDPVVVPDSVGPRDLRSLSRDYISPLEDPVSPSATSQDDVDDVFVLPQASSSPSGDNSYLESTDEVVPDGLRTEEPIETDAGISSSATTLDSSSENKQPVHKRKAVLEPLIDLTDDVCLSEVSENKSKTVIPHMNGNAKPLQRTLKERKLPMRSGRGTRLEAIVMDINSGRYKVSGCIRANKKAKASQPTARDPKLTSTKRKDSQSGGKRKSRAKASFSAKTMKQKAASPVKRGKTNNINTDVCKDSTSDSEINKSKKSHGITSPKSPQFSVHKNSKEPELPSHPGPSVEIPVARFSPPPPPSSSPPPESRSPKKSPGKAKGKAADSNTSPTAKPKRVRTPKSRRKKRQQSRSTSMFSPKEPEIKLRYVNYKEERRDFRLDSFSPFVRVQRQQLKPSLCTVINYPEEVRTQHKRGHQQAHPAGFVSPIVPSTSCLQLGRVSMHSQHQRTLVCCLCGLSANAMDLGDLHGPYYPEGYQPSTKTPASMSGLKEDEDDFSDSSSSSCSIRARRGRKSAVPPHLKEKGLLGGHRWAQAQGTGSPAAKRARLAGGSADVEDWYSPPVLPLEPCEYWIHEDCGIWSAGIFLVKGKVYGLEEAVKVAQETMCSACRDPGATLGCFFKGCPNKYHYRCALESDCVLIEENFSMKCKKHKNKTFKGAAGSRWDDR